tara:strand:+ start:824 stop:1471 length:648 start_codon:yes stop_codon:yes gene_type:complete
MNAQEYYDNNYFDNYQKQIGEFGGKANLFKFQKHISKGDKVLDFGCGGGFLLNNLNCKSKFGVEINPFAREYCKSRFGIECFHGMDQVPDNSIDVIITNHALEHCERPSDIINDFYLKLKKGGKIIIVVPLDSFLYKFKKEDVNKHLYSFSPMNLGNLILNAGFKNVKTNVVYHKWPPFWGKIQKFFGWEVFHLSCRVYGLINLYWTQTKGIAYK